MGDVSSKLSQVVGGVQFLLVVGLRPIFWLAVGQACPLLPETTLISSQVAASVF